MADTGSEKPETYDHVRRVATWLPEVGFPELVMVKRSWPVAAYTSLEDQCLRKGDLPSRAYGFSTCAYDWKLVPFWRFVRESMPPKPKPWKLVGFDGGEERRVKQTEDESCRIGYPLIEWGIDRDRCTEICEAAGFWPVPKSACFFCPSMKKHEILDLKSRHPDLLRRALELEANGHQTSRTTAGLGRSYSWADLIAADEQQLCLFRESPVESCTMCADEPEDT
jgi:hypothetical protein